ncbi:hypothetical protein HO133_005644 [Letharia lupina]|uniref:Fungal N-terminal domain-containing protein n=1 Tax=Letharia lupina TaxID=560253 RepID=A0A8H6F862_9LECA|nr:uncharacterized protein HO133_005644 [Letharia lupina]KAF6218298.1 hypothetical protein HO133_005644 [Letharia lupina]
MEVVAGVAGVAGVVGILGLVGQAVHGILKLKEFVHGVSTASETVKSFLRAIDSLESALTAISDLLRRTPEEWLVGAEARNTSRLASQIENCRADIDEWVKDVPMHHANSSKIIKSFFGKLRVASEESAYSVFHQKVARHLQGMQLSLDLLGCSYNIHILQQGSVIAKEVKNVAEAQTSFNHGSTHRLLEFDNSFVTHLDPVSSQLDRLENSSQMSSASMSSLASNVSRILELVSSNPALTASKRLDSEDKDSEPDVAHASSTRPAFGRTKLESQELLQRPSQTQVEWSCDILPGVEAAFSASGFICLYCGDEFDQDSPEWSLRDKHRRSDQKRGFHRGLESKDQNLTDDFHSIRDRRWEALFYNNRAVKAMHDHIGGAKSVSPSEERPWEMELNTAISEEGCIVDGLMVASVFSPRSISNDYGGEIRQPSYSLGDGIKVSRYEFEGRCDSFLHATRLRRTNDLSGKPGPDGADALGKSSATSVLPKGPSYTAEVTNGRNQINSWLREILQHSSTARIILFYTMKHGVNFSSMYTWLEKALEFWESDEAATKVDEPDSLSDGAVDSRGSPENRDVTNHETAKQLG